MRVTRIPNPVSRIPLMYVLALYGSPRQDGNTDILLNEFLKGSISSRPDAQIERVYIRDLSISPCRCHENAHCLKNGKCCIKDEMTPLYDKLLWADLVVLSAPVYFANVPAQVKIIIDRTQALWARKYILKIPSPKSKIPRRGFFISVAGTNGKEVFSGIVSTVKYFFKSINIDYAGDLFYDRTDNKGAILKHPTVLKDAFEAGKKQIENLKKQVKRNPSFR